MTLEQQVITDMGLLSQFSYKAFGTPPMLKNQSVSQFTDDGKTYVLNSSYTVIDYISTATDMQAILLAQNDSSGNPTSEYVIAFRGTEPDSWFDIGTDTIIGLGNYNPQFNDAKAFVQDMMATHNISAANLTLTGHSLGGILTQSVGAVLGIKGYAFNPYGTERLLTMWPNYSGTFYGSLINVGIYQVLNAFGIDSSYADFARENILNISYNDFGTLNGDVLSNFASALSSDHLGNYLPVFGDNLGLDGHTMSILNAAIQHYNEILAHFIETTTMNELSLAYIVSGKDGYSRSETVFSYLNIAGTPGHSLLLDILAFADSDGEITPKSPTDIESLARSDIAYRYALVNLNPFAVLGADYDRFNQSGELEIYNTATGNGQLSNMYLTDRADMLSWKMHYDVTDTDYGDEITADIAGDWDYSDFGRRDDGNPLLLKIDGEGIEGTNHQIVFGSTEGDVVEGDSRSDHLYGMAGNDMLAGYGGEDYLEGGLGDDILNGGRDNDVLVGGKGNDTYLFQLGGGNDTLRDSDGKGRIVVTDADGNMMEVAAGDFTQTDSGGSEWTSSSGNITLKHGAS